MNDKTEALNNFPHGNSAVTLNIISYRTKSRIQMNDTDDAWFMKMKRFHHIAIAAKKHLTIRSTWLTESWAHENDQ
jgi:hypothetical protein